MCLPTTIQYLSGLKRLEIIGCPELENRCREETGEDWPKIAHVQDLYISSAIHAYRMARRAAQIFLEAGLS
jgi:structure-specific endonuclease subunit SLX1